MSRPQVTAVAVLMLAVGAPAAVAADSPLSIAVDDAALKWGACPAIFPTGCEIGVLHGDPAKPNADVFLRVRGGQTLPAHTHSSAERMVLVSGRLKVKYRGAAEAVLTPGMYAFGPAGLPHSAACVGAGPCTLFIAFEGPIDAMAHTGSLD
ncbi:cupin domain-containing protein [Phenylobacterium sp.]|uniref:cupin domain-containing protein n=1 Tax=Phenylobacterium sp. TaxID=1871053 RepID=UPI0039836745